MTHSQNTGRVTLWVGRLSSILHCVRRWDHVNDKTKKRICMNNEKSPPSLFQPSIYHVFVTHRWSPMRRLSSSIAKIQRLECSLRHSITQLTPRCKLLPTMARRDAVMVPQLTALTCEITTRTKAT